MMVSRNNVQHIRIKACSSILLLVMAAVGQLGNINAQEGVFMNDPETNSCLVQISTYLDEFCSQKSSAQQVDEANMFGAHQQIVVALGEAQRHLEHTATLGESSLDTVFWSLDPSDECDRSKLLSMVQSLSDAFQDCDQTSLDYLMIVANFKFASTMSISEIAQERVEFCWQSFVSKVSSQLDRVMGKMSKPVFRNLEQVAAMWSKLMQPGKNSSGQRDMRPGSIWIDEQKARRRAQEERDDELSDSERPTKLDRLNTEPGEFEAVLTSLASIDFDRDADLRLLASAFNKMFEKRSEMQGVKVNEMSQNERQRQAEKFFTGFFVEPCQELKDRVQLIVSLGEIYKSHIKRPLGIELAKEKRTNRRLDYELQIYRVCKLGLAKKGTIAKSLG